MANRCQERGLVKALPDNLYPAAVIEAAPVGIAVDDAARSRVHGFRLVGYGQ